MGATAETTAYTFPLRAHLCSKCKQRIRQCMFQLLTTESYVCTYSGYPHDTEAADIADIHGVSPQTVTV